MINAIQKRLRKGFSLLEIVLSLAILGLSLGILGQIATTGTDAAREARRPASRDFGVTRARWRGLA